MNGHWHQQMDSYIPILGTLLAIETQWAKQSSFLQVNPQHSCFLAKQNKIEQRTKRKINAHDKWLKLIFHIFLLIVSQFLLYKSRNNLKSLDCDVIPGVSLRYKLVQKSKTPVHVLSVNQERLLFEPENEKEISFIAVLTLCLVCSFFEFVPTLNSLCTKVFHIISS